MSWRDQFRPGSFRGAAFVTLDHEHGFGRRGELTEYPFRDDPWFEDLGRRGDGWRLQVFVVGPDYMIARDALVDALKASGPGTLVHPFLGTFQAQFVDGRLTESTAEGGIARFDLSFVEPGVALTAAAEPDTQAAAIDASDATDLSAIARFATRFSIAGQPGFVADAAVTLIAGLASSIGAAASGVSVGGGAGPTLRTFQAGVAALGSARPLLASPANLAAVVSGMVAAAGELAPRAADRVAAARRMMGIAIALPPVPVPTPARIAQAANQQAIADLVVLAAAGAAVRAAAAATFASYDDAIAMRDALGDDLDDRALAAGDRADDATAADLDTLRRAMIVDVTARGGSLARLFGYTPPTVQPALVIAWELYRDPATVVARADELVARNAIAHPGFVPARTLQVLTSDGASDG